MSRPGRKPKPLHLVAGHRTKAELEERERSTPKPRPIAPRRPPHLSAAERECWDHHAPELERLGLLTGLDLGAFRLACASYALAVTALEEMRPRKADGSVDRRRRGFVVTVADPKYGTEAIKRHPAFSVYAAAGRDYRDWCARFGLTPSDRVGLRAGASWPDPTVDEDDDAAFFGEIDEWGRSS